MTRDIESTKFRILMKETFGGGDAQKERAENAVRRSVQDSSPSWNESHGKPYYQSANTLDDYISYNHATSIMISSGIDVLGYVNAIQQINAPQVYDDILRAHSPSVANTIVLEIQRKNPTERVSPAPATLAELNGKFYGMANLAIAYAIAIGQNEFLADGMLSDDPDITKKSGFKSLLAVKAFMSQKFPKGLNMDRPAESASELLKRLQYAFPDRPTSTSAMAYFLANNKDAFKGRVQCPLDDFAQWSHLEYGKVLKTREYQDRFSRQVFSN
ncbi:MAG TPA: hypothetical protein VF189_04250 [Patescibacteria group bacterium]